MTSDPLTAAEIEAFAAEWYRKLDEHVPAAEIVPMVSARDLEFQLPEGPLTSAEAFRAWYEGVIRVFFDEVHTLVSVDVVPGAAGRSVVKVVVNWQLRRWRPPAPRSEWAGFDAFQTWEMSRADDGRPVIDRYVVDELRPMPGSPPL